MFVWRVITNPVARRSSRPPGIGYQPCAIWASASSKVSCSRLVGLRSRSCLHEGAEGLGGLPHCGGGKTCIAAQRDDLAQRLERAVCVDAAGTTSIAYGHKYVYRRLARMAAASDPLVPPKGYGVEATDVVGLHQT